jgi:hypothetical protein
MPSIPPSRGLRATVDKSEVLRNQHLFREVNQRIAEITAGQQAGGAEFLCECGRDDCHATLALDLSEYNYLRDQDGFFLVAPGHLVEGVDRLVDTRDGYELVVADSVTG